MCFVKGRKHCGKRRKCWLPAFYPFPTMYSKGFFVGEKSGLCGKGLTDHCIEDGSVGKQPVALRDSCVEYW